MLYPTHRKLPTIIRLITLLLTPGLAFAEVSDKVPSMMTIWTLGVSAAVLCLITARFRAWLTPIVGLLPLLWFVSLLMEIHSADVAPHLYAEQGLSYYVQSYIALALLSISIWSGIFMNIRRKKHKKA
jgi:hypothetical protein